MAIATKNKKVKDMKTLAGHGLLLAVALLLATTARGQAFEMLISLDGVSATAAHAAMNEMFSDRDMKDARATLYAADLGVEQGSLLIVADFSSYEERATRDARRLSSHGWSRFQLAMQDADILSMNMAGVVADYGKPRHTAAYLTAFVSKVTDQDAYAAALAELNRANGNPGVLRLVALRTGSRAATHAVLVGGDSFAAVNKYMDDLFASEAFESFAGKVQGIREMVRISSYRRLGAWGY